MRFFPQILQFCLETTTLGRTDGYATRSIVEMGLYHNIDKVLSAVNL